MIPTNKTIPHQLVRYLGIAFTMLLCALPVGAQETRCAKGDITQPVRGSVLLAKYPRQSLDAREAGSLIVRALISESGWTQEVTLQQSSTYAALDQAALEAAQRWRYSPGLCKGVPTALWVTIPFNFVLPATATGAGQAAVSKAAD